MIVLTVALILFALLSILLVIQNIRKERELRRMAWFLRSRDVEDNARLTAEVRSKGVLELDRVINDELDALQAERIRLERQEREFRQGLAGLSHDIRTPLAGAQGYMQLLDTEEDPALRLRYHEGITRRLEDLKHLLDQLFLYVQVSDADYALECSPVDANAILAESLATFYPEFSQRGWTPGIELANEVCTVRANEEALSRIFRNLIANALCHGSTAPQIRQQGSTFVFENRLHAPQLLEPGRLFERFYTFTPKGTERSGSRRGSGLGLAIVAQLAAAIDAGVTAELQEDRLVIRLCFE
ncbi:MAG TPA: sensor histidine kinase [Coriobacteriia bacterium]|nr:sensor histidine kinase [Coriobacteriia bacterium]